MKTKKPTNPRDYELTEFDVPMLRLEPVQTTAKRLELPQAGINALLNNVSEIEHDVTKQYTFPTTSTKH